jgi:hypothetical protein
MTLTHHPNSSLPLEGLKQEIRDLFSQVTTGFEPTENEIQMLESGLDCLFLPELPIDDYAAARVSLEATIAWLEAGNDALEAAKELRLNVSRLVAPEPTATPAKPTELAARTSYSSLAMPGILFWITEQDSLNELCPAEVLLGQASRMRGDVHESQKRMLSYPPGVRYEKVQTLVRMHNAEQADPGLKS